MVFNIIQAVEAQVTPETVNEIAGSTGESAPRARAATSAGVLAIVTGLVHRGSSRSGAQGLLSTLQAPGAARGGTLATELLGERADHLTDSVASSTGVSRGAASGVMSTLLPIAASVLGREVISRKLDAGGLSEMLQSQKQHIVAHPNLPDGLRAMLGGAKDEVEGPAAAAKEVGVYSTTPSTIPTARETRPHPKRSSGALMAALALGALALLALLMAFGRRPTEPKVSAPEMPKLEAPHAAAPAAPTVEPPAARAPTAPEPTGQTTVTKAEVEKPQPGGLAAHFEGTGPLPDRFALPNVQFGYGSTTMTRDGNATVDELASLMKQHGSSKVLLTGYTDSAGTDDVNVPLSTQRAETVKKMLVDRGVDASRIETKGKGGADPIASNATKAGRAQNRRIEATILQR